MKKTITSRRNKNRIQESYYFYSGKSGVDALEANSALLAVFALAYLIRSGVIITVPTGIVSPNTNSCTLSTVACAIPAVSTVDVGFSPFIYQGRSFSSSDIEFAKGWATKLVAAVEALEVRAR